MLKRFKLNDHKMTNLDSFVHFHVFSLFFFKEKSRHPCVSDFVPAAGADRQAEFSRGRLVEKLLLSVHDGVECRVVKND